LPLQLRARRVYILPTRSGVAAGVLLFLMLLAGLNYNNSLALLLCFMLGGVAVFSMYECHRMLVGLKIDAGHVEPSFAGRGGELTLQFANEDSRARARLTARCGPCDATRFTLPPAAVQVVRVSYPGLARGRQRLPRIELASDAPLGLFRVWTWLHLPLEAMVYPTPAGSRPLPPMGGYTRDGRNQASRSGEEDWALLRPFREGDPPRSVAWKAYARGAPLLVSQYEATSGAHRLLDYTLLAELNIEQRLSQLTQWVLDCDHRGASYRLALPGRALPPREGPAQRRASLEALALFQA
jgi:uncharacterized protein (DUF58 family)